MFYYLNTKDKKYRTKKDHLIILYNHSTLTITEIRQLLDLTQEDLDDMINKCYKEKKLNTNFRQYPLQKPKNYYRYHTKDNTNTNYVIKKSINGKYVYYCYCKTEAEAKFIVKELRKVNWDKSKIKEIKNKIK